MASPDSEQRRRSSESPSSLALAGWCWVGLILSFAMLALAPFVVADSYSMFEDTLSESGGQGVDGAWVLRSGVLLGSASVFAMTSLAQWAPVARVVMRVYAVALVGLVIFPEAPWYGGAHDGTVAYLHTVSGVVGAVAFMVGVVLISRSRPSGRRTARAFDWLVVVTVALVPQIMVLAGAEGVLQRIMVGVGYGWLFVELGRITGGERAVEKTAGSIRDAIPWTGDRIRLD